ncbi:MAG: phage GP46 family protein [Parvibaculum sedimenti]|uniref:phage GP46 family protein n=1 Tax=Parvibaculum sedimenti TaxID=2608632 RepID=UPI003BB72C7D
MTDIALVRAADGLRSDLGFDGDLLTDDGLRTACIISVETDARATDDDLARFGLDGADKRGWWADSIVPVVTGDNTGSLLWLLERAKQTEEVRRIAKDMIARALEWLIENKIAKSVDVTTQWGASGRLNWRASIVKVDGSRFDVDWQASLKEIA